MVTAQTPRTTGAKDGAVHTLPALVRESRNASDWSAILIPKLGFEP